MKTGYQKLDAARDGVGTAASVGFTTYANTMPASQEEAPYLGRAQPGATADQSEVASLMVKRGSQMGTAEIVRIWNETAFHVKDTLLEGRALALDLGFVRLYPAISGTFPTADAAFDREANRLYIAATPSDDIRDALKKGSPTRSDETAAARSAILKVTWGDALDKNTIKSGERIIIICTGVTLGNGGERAELRLPDDAGAVPVTLEETTPADDGRQRFHGHLAQPVDACEGATLWLWTHGLTPEADLYPVHSDKLTVLAGDAPPEPTFTGVYPAEYPGEAEFANVVYEDGDIAILGANLTDDMQVSLLKDGAEVAFTKGECTPTSITGHIGGTLAVLDEFAFALKTADGRTVGSTTIYCNEHP